jgi:hypothetical protein
MMERMGVDARCETCMFWDGAADIWKWPRIKYKQCRRGPPSGRKEDGWNMGNWPVTPSGAWCGEFKPQLSSTPAKLRVVE